MIYGYKHVCMSYTLNFRPYLIISAGRGVISYSWSFKRITLYLSCPKASTGLVISVFLFMNRYQQQID